MSNSGSHLLILLRGPDSQLVLTNKIMTSGHNFYFNLLRTAFSLNIPVVVGQFLGGTYMLHVGLQVSFIK